MREGQIDAAWVPEPYPTYLVSHGVGRVLVDEASLWPKGQFVTADLAASTAYMDAHPEWCSGLVAANVDAIRSTQSDPDRARWVARQGDRRGRRSARSRPSVIDQAWSKLAFTWQVASGRDGHAWPRTPTRLGVLDERPGDLAGMYRLDDLNTALKDRDLPPVEVPR